MVELFVQVRTRRDALPDVAARGQHSREGIMAPTTPTHRVRIMEQFYRCCRCDVNRVDRIQARSVGDGSCQKMPRAALASSDIISGLHGGRNTISGRTSPTPVTGARN